MGFLQVAPVLLFIVGISTMCTDATAVKWDPSGYIMHCPCMGRFGNQAEQFLGAMRFAKSINRTLVVPPWIVYNSETGTGFTPYSTWFDIEELAKYHRVIPMETFMEKLAPEHWPDSGDSRKVYCPSRAVERSPDKKSCPAKIGNPFGPFWNNLDIDFASSEVYDYVKLGGYNAKTWTKKYPPEDHPVIALMGAPGSFPVQQSNRGLQKYIKWNYDIQKLAEDFIESNLERPFIGIHLRNGVDWVRACEHVESHSGPLMASPQCCGYSSSPHKLTKEMCLPSKDVIVQRVQEVAKLHNAKDVFVATDKDAMLSDFKQTSLKIMRYSKDDPIMDLAILSMADAFIGNCVSSFTAFVVRHREVSDKKNYFFAFDHPHPKIAHDEL